MAALHWALLLCLTTQLLNVDSYTLYKWIEDSRTRFNYDPSSTNVLGVNNWRNTYPESCGGELQSPIDIKTDQVRYGRDLPCPQMLYTTTLLRGELKNNGHSATFEPVNESLFRLTNVPYRPGVYNMNDFHLHYGGVDGRIFTQQGQRFRGSGIMSAGSEHTIDGLRFEGELHFVFYNSKYKDLEEADNKTDGVVIVVILVQKLPGNVVDSDETSSFSKFLEMSIPRIAPYQQNATMDVDLSMFFNRGCQFYTYFGSTTTPVCHESVQWFLLRQPIRVTERAWFQLTRLQSRGDFNARFGNYRPTQPMNNRVVEANFPFTVTPILPSPNSEVVRPRLMAMGMSTMGLQTPSLSGEQMMNNSTILLQNNQPINNQEMRSSRQPINNQDLRIDVLQRMGQQNAMMGQQNAMMGQQNAMMGQQNTMVRTQPNPMAVLNAGFRQTKHPEPPYTVGNGPQEQMRNDPTLLQATRMSKSANILTPYANQFMPKNTRLPARPRNSPRELFRQGTVVMKTGMVQPFNFPSQKQRQEIQGLGGQMWTGPNGRMKDSFMERFYMSDIWKKICELWKRTMS